MAMQGREFPFSWMMDQAQLRTKPVSTEIRMGFVRKVYALVSCQLVATFLIAAPIALQGPLWAEQRGWLALVGTGLYLGTVFFAAWYRDMLRRAPWNYAGLAAITVGMSIMIGFTSAMYTWQSVLLTAGLTALIFISLTIFAWKTNRDFTSWAPFGCAAAMLFLFFTLAVMVLTIAGVHVNMMVTCLDLCGVAFFIFFVIVDTQMMLGEWGGHEMQFQVDDYCLGALQLYLDFADMFLYILNLLGAERKQKDCVV